jgi:hypothetical protein
MTMQPDWGMITCAIGGPVPGHRVEERVCMQRSTRQFIALAVALPLSIYTTVSLAYVSTYSDSTYNRAIFKFTYDGNLYRYRVVGRELVLGVADVIHGLGLHVYTISSLSAQGTHVWDLFNAFLIVNGVAYIGLAILLYIITVKDRAWSIPYLILIVLIALSAYVVTPYDYLSYLLIAAALLTACAARPWSWPACLVLAIVGTATRESFLVGVAALVAIVLARPGGVRQFRSGGRTPGPDELLRATVAAIVGSLGTYVILRVVLSDNQHTTLWGVSLLKFNWNMSSSVAVFITVTGTFALFATFPERSMAPEPPAFDYGRATWYFWLLSLPYLAVTFVTGVWYEALRLLLPLLLGQYLVRHALDTAPSPDPAHGGPVTGRALEGSSSATIGADPIVGP